MMRLLVPLFLVLALLPAAALAHEGTEVSVNGDVRPNGSIEVEGADFEPNDVVRIELRKDGVEPVELGTVQVGADGSFVETLHVPATVRPGLYLLAADGQESATFDVTVLEPADGSEPATPAGESAASVENDRPVAETIGLAVFTALVAAAAAAALWWSRTRPRPFSET